MENLKDTIINDRYRIEDVAGIGGMAAVYRAVDLSTNTRVAIKVLKDEYIDTQSFKKRFENESRIIEMLDHENIVKIYNVGFNQNLYYFVMEYVDGISLKQYIDQEKKVSLNQAVYFMTQLLKAMIHAHSKGIIHRDIKPQNIMLLHDGSVKVMDFGIAKHPKFATQTLADNAIGTVHYISPEQVKGQKCDFRSDIYSAGITFYEMLTGQLPFDGDTPVAVALKQIKDLPRAPRDINPEIPPAFNEIILKAISKKPEDRYQSAEEFLNDIQKAKSDGNFSFGYKLKFVQSKTPEDDTRPTAELQSVPKLTQATIMSMSRRQKTKLFAIGGTVAAVLLVLIVIGVVSLVSGNLSGNIKVPNLVGRSAEDAKYPYITVVVEGEEFSDEFPAGVICRQSPNNDVTVKRGQEVRVWVSLGKEWVRIPNVVGFTSTMAVSRLADLGFKCITEYEYSDNYDEGIVIRTEPSANSDAEKGTTIRMFVSKRSLHEPITVTENSEEQ